MSDFDAIDDKILRNLSSDGRISNTQLADRVGLSPSACLRRVQDLERRGVIRGYRARLDPEHMGRGFVAYVTVGLSDHSRDAQADFERAMMRFDEVRECHNITGTFEYLLRVETGSLADYREFHSEKLGMQAGVRQITSHIVMASPKDERG